MEENPKVYIRTFGCQMNDRDSENMVALLSKKNFEQTGDPNEADLILVNTCSIREHASQKAASQLGRLAKIKSQSPRRPLIGVTGCLAQQEGEKFLQRFPFIDFLVGPDAIGRVPRMVEEIQTVRQQQNRRVRPSDLQRDLEEPEFVHEFLSYPVGKPEERGWGAKVSAFVIISKGCDFRCTFCVVPNTRGPERSMPADEVLAEVRHLNANGVREIILLGQNVNSYGKNFSPPSSFAKLLRRIETEIPVESALQRIRFTTSHPIDLEEDLMQCFAELPRLCGHLHLPVQSGDDGVLRRMKRLYTVEDYRRRLARLRSYAPKVALSTDIIVGFPGEGEGEFQRTLDLLREVRYNSIYAFKYSSRPFTPAAKLADDVGEEVKNERLARLLACQQEISREQNQLLEGTEQEVLVEGPNRHSNRMGFTGRTPCNGLVHFSATGDQDLRGKLVKVQIEKGQANSLLGKLVVECVH